MDDDILEGLIQSEISQLSPGVQNFLVRERVPFGAYHTWDYFAHGYNAAFEQLMREALQRWPNMDYLAMPLFFLCRHSIELELKGLVQELAGRSGRSEDTSGHNLLKLWEMMIGELAKAGFSIDDHWTKKCRKIVMQLHKTDPDGERFRYPMGKSGRPFDYKRVVLEGLFRAHWNVSMYCDATATMLHEADWRQF